MRAVLSSENNTEINCEIEITGSKSESNRLLLLKAFYPNLTIRNLSESDDTVVLSKALRKETETIDIHHAGTAMRFLTAYFSTQPGETVVLTGSRRMQERPIGVLVDALRGLGAHIEYMKEDGCPPLKIQGQRLTGDQVTIASHISSQYISALMLIAPSLSNGLRIRLEGKVTSVPYIIMTLSLLEHCGIEGSIRDGIIHIPASEKIKNTEVTVESDWSSASYFYSIVALSKESTVTLKSFRKNSLQGDAALSKLYERLGVHTEFRSTDHAIILSKANTIPTDKIEFDLSNTPDIAQTIAVTCFGLGKECHLTGLHTLKIKETDRLIALKTEMEKLGAVVEITNDALYLSAAGSISEDISIDTYNDHRMAMAFAPLALRVPLAINDSQVVSKSFPTFWEDLAKTGVSVSFE